MTLTDSTVAPQTPSGQPRNGTDWWQRVLHYRPPQRYVPLLATAGVLTTLYLLGRANYPRFGRPQVVLNIFIDNSFLFVVAVGMTFVILTGGIDLSVGSVVALTTVLSATLLSHGWPAYAVLPLVLAIGATLGLGMGSIIHYFDIQPFIVTLAGLFLARGLTYSISTSSIPIRDPFWTFMSQERISFGRQSITLGVVIALVVILVGIFVLGYTRLGRTVYAIGGNEQSALLMGLPVARTKVAVYTISGFCSALGGVLFTFYLPSGDPLHAVGMELDAIAAVVIGGTLLTGGSGYLVGTVLGVLTLGLIKTILNFEGTLTSWWAKIVIGLLLFAFILLQRLVIARRR
ncbi:MAG TPA: galactofuranose ABC transporter, permease protein YjfF [Micromonosporaceae bacterium]|nr:galactofuranose ABC transporter, permease protein YjfF [Micromonosporaceae bacterium]